MKKKIGVILASLFTSVFCAGAASVVGTTLTHAASDPTANNKTSVFVSPNETITEMSENVAFPASVDKTTTGSLILNEDGKMPTNGIGIYAEGGSGMFQYSIPVQMTGKTKDDVLIECYPLGGSEYALMTDLTITLTDTANAKNTIGLYIYTHTNGAIYSRVEYAGKSLALSNESAAAGRLHDGNYGAVGYGYSFSGAGQNHRPIAMSIDYADRSVYLITSGRTTHEILDLDEISQVGKNSLWQGFENDEATISVTMNFAAAKKGGCVVKSILGTNLEGSFETAEDYAAPTVRYLCDPSYVEDMPLAGKNVPYAIPEVYAFDWFFGKTPKENILVEAYKKSGTGEYVKYTADDLTDGFFTAKESGDFELRYTVANEQRVTTESLFVSVVDELAPIIAVQVEEYATPVILESFYIPEVNVFGGSGILEKKEQLFYNGLEVTLLQTRRITLDKAGVLALRVECTGYTGETLVEYFSVEIPEATVLAVSEVPMILQSGVETQFPTATAYDSLTGTPASVKVYLDEGNGRVEAVGGKVKTTKDGGTVDVIYVATSARGEQTRTFTIPVLNKQAAEIKPQDYLLTMNGSFEMNSDYTGLQVWTQENDSQAVWAYPLVTGASTTNATILLSLLKKTFDNGTPNDKTDDYSVVMENFEYIDVVFSDYQDVTKEMFVRIYRVCELNEKMSYIQINGVGTKYLIDGAISDPTQNLNFYINTATGYLYNGTTFVPVAELPDDYTASVSKVSYRFGGVDGQAGVLLKAIGNQSLNMIGTKWTDSIAPMVSFSRVLQPNSFLSANDTFIVPAMTAYDLRSSGAKVTVRVLFNGKVIYQAENPTEEKLIVADQVGQYTINVTAEDTGAGREPFLYILKVVDETAPTLTVEKLVIAELANGTTIIVPKATATDNLDTECLVYVYVQHLESHKIYQATMGETFTFTRTGTYQIRYFAYDSDFNYVEYIMDVKVV